MADGDLRNDLRRARERVGLTQQALAERAGISRQALSAVEAGRATPSTEVALRLARALGCRIEEIFWLDAAPGTLRAEVASAGRVAAGARVLVGRIADRWVAHPLPADRPGSLFTAADGLIEEAGPGGTVRVRPLASADALGGGLLVAGCAPALGVLARRLGESPGGVRLGWIEASSHAALDLLGRGHVHVAGAHLLDEASGEFNVPFARRVLGRRGALVVHLARWDQGIVVRRGNPRGVRGVADLVRPDLRVVDREPGAGARALVERLLRAEGLAAPAGVERPVVRGHMEVAQAVALGAADAGVAVRGAALAYGLDFVPLAEERFDLALWADAAADPRVVRLLDTLDSRHFRSELASLGGYGTDETGHVLEEGRGA